MATGYTELDFINGTAPALNAADGKATAALEMGFISGGEFNYQTRNKEWEGIGALYTSLEASAQLKTFYIGGSMDCYFTPEGIGSFSPFQMTYVFNAGLDFDNIQIGYEHSCFHPMQPYATIIGNEIKPKYEGSLDKFFARISTK